jgi:CHAD domain-containing protein
MLETPAIDVLRELLERQLRAIERSQAGVRDGADPEDLHRFRVATRRARALIRASRPLIRDQLAALDRELRWLGGVSGPVRDLDVLIDHIRDLVDELEPDQAGAESIIAGLERERLAQRETLLRAIDGDRFRELLARSADALPMLVPYDDEVGLRRLAERELGRLRSAYEELRADPPDEEFHAVRIKAKHARYAAELAARAEGRPLASLVEALRELQDVIGAHQDAVVAERRVRALASQDSALAVGRIVELERQRRLEARARVPELWKRIRRAGEQAF